MEGSYQYNNVSFVVKRNPQQESKEERMESVRDCCARIQKPRDGKTAYGGQIFRDVTFTLLGKTEKIVDIWTNFPLPDQKIIYLYHAHGERTML